MSLLFRPSSGVSLQTFGGRRFRRFYGPALLSAALTTLYTVPSGRRAVIRHIHVSNNSTSSADFSLGISTPVVILGEEVDTLGYLWEGQPVPANGLLQHFRDHTLVDTDRLVAASGSAGVLNLTIDGYEEIFSATAPAVDEVTFGEDTFGSGTYGGN